MKKDVRDVIQGEEPHLNNLLTQEDLSDFKGMVDELRDTWTKKQMFRTETEARFSVLQDNRYPTKAAKYWQCVREQSSYLDNLMALSFDYRRNDAKIKYLEKKIANETDTQGCSHRPLAPAYADRIQRSDTGPSAKSSGPRGAAAQRPSASHAILHHVS